MSLQEQVRAALHACGWSAGDELLVGVSGGPDSVALLHALTRQPEGRRLRLCVVHVDHCLRTDSAADAEFVEEMAARWRVPCVRRKEDVRARARKERRSLEDAARRARYEAFAVVARERGASGVALAHTADDQAETVCMRLLRGAGLTGLAGMAPRRMSGDLAVIRPLLGVWRVDIEAYLAGHRLAARQDPTNMDRRILRNRIRHELLPLLERDYNPNVRRLLAQLAGQCRADLDYLDAATRRHWKRLAKVEGEEIFFRLPLLARQPLALRRQIIRLAIVRLQGALTRFEFRHWEAIEALLAERSRGSVVDLPQALQACREEERLVLRRMPGAIVEEGALASEEASAVY